MSTQCYDCVATLKNLGTVDSADALREFESLAVGLHVLNCELFAGRCRYRLDRRCSILAGVALPYSSGSGERLAMEPAKLSRPTIGMLIRSIERAVRRSVGKASQKRRSRLLTGSPNQGSCETLGLR